MHAEWGPSGGTGREYYDNYCLLARRIIIFIYHGQALRSQVTRAEYAFLCPIQVVNKEIDSLPPLRTAASQRNLVEQVYESLLMTRLTTILYAEQPQQGRIPIKGATPSGLGRISRPHVHRTSVVAHDNVLIFLSTSRFHLHWPGDVNVKSTQVFSCASVPFLMWEVYRFCCDTCSARIKTRYLLW